MPSPLLARRIARAVTIGVLAAVALLLGRPGVGSTAPAELTARGLDVFLHAPTTAAPGSTLQVAAIAIGFPALATTAPLEGATIEATWDPETLELDRTGSALPPTVSARTDARGRAVLAIPVPEGDPRTLALLVAVRDGGKERVQRIAVERVRRDEVDLFVGERRVVPGGATTAWALVRDVATGAPRAGARVEVTLREGTVERHRAEAVTDAGGTAAFRVPIPASREPSITWELVARVASGDPARAPSARLRLTVREETPAQPRIDARFDAPSVRPGASAAWRVRLRDATDAPVPRTEVRVWTGPAAARPPADEEGFRKVSASMTTSLDGEVRGALPAPGVVPPGGVEMKIVARARARGVALEGDARVHVGVRRAEIGLEPERGRLVPGVEQRLFLHLRAEDDRPLAGAFRVRGDGLDATATLDAHGEAEVTWAAPVGVGGHRGVGPCSGDVAAAVQLEPADDAARASLAGARIAGWDDLPLCVPVDRDAELLVRVDPPVVRAGDPIRVTVRGARGRGASVLVATEDGGRSAAAWAADGEAGVELRTPDGASGIVRVDVAVPRAGERALVASGAALVVPGVLPRVEGKIVSTGPARPGGTVTVEARVHDGRGGPLPGTVAVAVIDRWGGGSFGGLHDLDTRLGLCRKVGVTSERCSELLGGAATLLGRSSVAGVRAEPGAPARDPGAAVREEAVRTFRAVVHSLEGAIYEASNEPERLPDVRRREGGGWTFNPELLTLATAAMDPPPVTPGGEPIALADLIAVDRQVTFDHVARRVTRLKLYQVLQAIHEHRRDEGLLDPDEPALRAVDAMLRRLVRAGAITDAMLTDPWGGRIAAARTRAAGGLPFLRPAPGWELRSPGPDGRPGNADDVTDPFERVLASGTPYADAVDEDRLVDARLDMRVADATVASWRSLLEQLTGTSLGGLALTGVGSGGGGSGYGSGHGRIGSVGRGRGTGSIPSGIAYWSGPRRTDAQGVLRIEVPLGDVETTWSIGLVAVPDGARPAFGSVDVAATLPLSATVDAGARWVVGDRVGAAVTLKNRTAADVEATLAVAVGGALVADGALPARVRVPAQGATTVVVPARARSAGTGTLEVHTSAPGSPPDRLVHQVAVIPAGDELVLSRATMTAGKEVSLREGLTRVGLVPLGPATLVLERPDAGVLRGALSAVDPARLVGDAELADAADVGARIHAWATARLGERDALTLLAARTRDEALGRLVAIAGERGGHAHPSTMRAARWSADETIDRALGAKDCPDARADGALPVASAIDLLDAEPALDGGAMPACWGSYVGTLLGELQESDDPVALARAISALAERRHRVEDVAALGRRLARLVAVRPSGAIALEGGRAERALVYAALLRAPPAAVAADRAALLGWLLVQRDAGGGFGHAAATRAAVRALLAPGGVVDDASAVAARIDVDGDGARTIDVPAGRAVRVPVARGAADVTVEAPSPGVLARVERRFLRPWSRPAPAADSPLHLAVRWPTPRAGDAAPVRVIVSTEGRGSRLVDVRVPLPPGAHLAAPVSGVREVQGQLLWRTTVRESELFVEVPVRFDLAGRVTVPEALASDAGGNVEPARSPARPLVVSPR